jgi:hypothetical protein
MIKSHHIYGADIINHLHFLKIYIQLTQNYNSRISINIQISQRKWADK